MRWSTEYEEKYQVLIHAWQFMTNHVRMLMTPKALDGISKLMQILGRDYVRYFNYSYRRTGTLWEERYKSCVVSVEDYFLQCQRYIGLTLKIPISIFYTFYSNVKKVNLLIQLTLAYICR